MATSTISSGHSAQPGRGMALLLGLALLAGLVFIIGFALPYFSVTQEQFGANWPRRYWLLLHITTGIVALLIGPFQLWMGFTGRRLPLHRTLGKVYMGAILISSMAAYYLAFNTSISWVFGVGLAGLATAWLTTTGMALAAIRRRLFEQHKEWMVRSYVVTFGFVFFRMFVGATEAAGVGATIFERLSAASWFCWAAPLLVTEAIIQGRKIFSAPAVR